jgi:hypothetical protein
MAHDVLLYLEWHLIHMERRGTRSPKRAPRERSESQPRYEWLESQPFDNARAVNLPAFCQEEIFTAIVRTILQCAYRTPNGFAKWDIT